MQIICLQKSSVYYDQIQGHCSSQTENYAIRCFHFQRCLCTENWYWDRICTLVYIKHFGPFITSLLWENKMNRCTLDIHEFIFCVLHLVHENLSTITLLKFVEAKQRKICLQETICCLKVQSAIFWTLYSALSLVLHESVLMPPTYLLLFPLVLTGI